MNEGNSDYLRLKEEIRIKSDVAQEIYDIRVSVDLTQEQLAKLVGVEDNKMIALEDVDYERDVLSMLAHIASALDQNVEIHCKPARTKGLLSLVASFYSNCSIYEI